MDEEMKRELAGIKTHLAGVDKHLEGVDKRLEGVDKRLDTMETVVRRIAINQAKLEGRFDELTDTIKSVFRQELGKIRATLDDFLPLVEQARHDRSRNDKAFMRHQDRLDDHERRLARLEARP